MNDRIIWFRIRRGYDAWLRTQCQSNSKYDGEIVSIRGICGDDVYVSHENTSFNLPSRFIEGWYFDDSDNEVAISSVLRIAEKSI